MERTQHPRLRRPRTEGQDPRASSKLRLRRQRGHGCGPTAPAPTRSSAIFVKERVMSGHFWSRSFEDIPDRELPTYVTEPHFLQSTTREDATNMISATVHKGPAISLRVSVAASAGQGMVITLAE